MITFVIIILNSLFNGTAADTFVCYDEITEWNCVTVADLPTYERAEGSVLVYAGSREHIQTNYLDAQRAGSLSAEAAPREIVKPKTHPAPVVNAPNPAEPVAYCYGFDGMSDGWDCYGAPQAGRMLAWSGPWSQADAQWHARYPGPCSAYTADGVCAYTDDGSGGPENR